MRNHPPDEESSTCNINPVCSCSVDDTSDLTVSCNTTGTVALRYGWTSIGVYSYIHPALLNQLQIQLPFYVLRTFVNNKPSFSLERLQPTTKYSSIPVYTYH